MPIGGCEDVARPLWQVRRASSCEGTLESTSGSGTAQRDITTHEGENGGYSEFSETAVKVSVVVFVIDDRGYYSLRVRALDYDKILQGTAV